MEPRLAVLAADLDNELHELDLLLAELVALRRAISDPPTTIELRVAGSIVQHFFNGVVRIFERVAPVIDSSLPSQGLPG
jgi:hypothetical protein